MKILIIILKIIGQTITTFIVFVLAILIISLRVPQNDGMCDADHVVLAFVYLIFIFLSIGLLINSIYFFRKNNWKIYRRIIIVLILVTYLLMLIFQRNFYIRATYGKKKYLIEAKNNDSISANIKLYDNHGFISEIYNRGCFIETIGSYEITKEKLILHFENNQCKCLGKYYQIKHDVLIPKRNDAIQLEFK